MKTATVFLLCSAALFSSCTFSGEGPSIQTIFPKQGKGPITKKEFVLTFDEIKVAQSIHAEIVKSEKEKVVISAPNDIIDDVVVDSKDGSLSIRFKPGINISADRVKAIVYAKDFSKITASSSADVVVKDKFTQDKTSVKVSSSASVKGELEANDFEIDASSSSTFSGKVWAVNLNVEVSSSADIHLSGKTKTSEMAASSSGSIHATDVTAQSATLKASSSGSITLGVQETLNATASSSGSIDVSKRGPLQNVTKTENSAGTVNVH